MAYQTENHIFAQGQTAQVGGAITQTDLEKAVNAISAALVICEEIAGLEIALLGYPNATEASKESAVPPVPDAILPRLGASAEDLMRAVKKALSSLSRINGAL